MKGNNKGIYVILPIYKDVDMTRACIKSAMPGILGIPNTSLIAINDGSPDAGMDEMLSEMSSEYGATISVLKNEKNLGFVQTVNRGFGQSVGKDVVLLNSDVVVSGDWLRRLRDVCYSESNIGTVTPFSNNATICSFPAFLEEQELPQGWTQSEIDRIFSLRDLPPVDAPTGVGFCMFIKAKCLESVGILNYEKFGRGYGEENDFCQRAIKLGWRNVITSNVFGYHKGGVSFSTEKNALVERAMKTLDELHPNYHRDVQAFVKNDPLLVHRTKRSLDLLRLTSKKIILAISHELGGGVKQHVEELQDYISDKAHTILITPCGGGEKVAVHLFMGKNTDKLTFQMDSEYPQLLEILKYIGISFVHFHHTHGLHPKVWSIPTDLALKYVMTAHDYYWLGANPTLTDESGIYYPDSYLDAENHHYPLPNGINQSRWRENHAPLIDNANLLIFPSVSTKNFFNGFYSTPNRAAIYHPEHLREFQQPKRTVEKRESPIKMAAIGALGMEKGADLLAEVAKILIQHEIKTILIGYAYRNLENVITLGAYQSNDLLKIIKDNEIDFFFFPARWPETYSYTLSYALSTGLPIVAPNVGAFSERLCGLKNAYLFNHLDNAERIAAFVVDCIQKTNEPDGRLLDFEQAKSSNYYRNEYLQNASGSKRYCDTGNFPNLSLFMENTKLHINTKEIVLLYLWMFYQSKIGSIIGSFFPFRFKRFVKRFLSNRSMADILNEKK